MGWTAPVKWARAERLRPMSTAATVFYKRSNFVTHLPARYLYSPSHFWLAPEDPAAEATARPHGRWRIGFTKFATRMLGEMVDHQWEKTYGEAVRAGEIIGSIEGFKASLISTARRRAPLPGAIPPCSKIWSP